MGFESKFINYGIIKIEGQKVKLYSTASNHIYINIGKDVANAVWSGNVLNVYLSDGKVRSYTSTSNYTNI
ncbi:hypothetical protein HNP37_004465 [Flavobacterium nitrogenifigens]|uniref:Uncharacterized protein n=2 Tax=Flavobacterium TaxID=237 RepID=A0A7W7N8Z6_9FLAO|nr:MULTISPECIES: hypothetical protein [Flavobacterium]MBB4804378.1 hypothetical protein [Flavobacterium nitrogenifigens]MBB6389226.1 hypothetical protein [Flavobacterium notoginsengisoli]